MKTIPMIVSVHIENFLSYPIEIRIHYCIVDIPEHHSDVTVHGTLQKYIEPLCFSLNDDKNYLYRIHSITIQSGSIVPCFVPNDFLSSINVPSDKLSFITLSVRSVKDNQFIVDVTY